MSRVLAAATLLCLASCGDEAATSAQQASQPKGKRGAPRAAMVEVATVEAGTLTDHWNYLGHVKPRLQSTLAAGVSGHITAVNGREGDPVSAGDVMVLLDTKVIAARLAAARAEAGPIDAELTQAKNELKRARKLPDSVVPSAERERYAARVATLRAQVQASRARAAQISAELDRHAVKAPFDGMVTQRLVDPGGWVNPGDPLLAMMSVDDLEVHVDVAAALRPHLIEGQMAKLLGSPPIDAKLLRVVEALDPTTRTLRVRLAPQATAPWLVPGAPVEVQFGVTINGDGVLVPRDAVVRGPVSARVVKLDGDSAKPVQVKILATADDGALVAAEGLAVGDKVITRGNERLRPGQPVKVITK